MTKNTDVNELLVNEVLRGELVGRVEVLDRVKELLLLPNTEFGTKQQVADFYNVSTQAIQKIVTRNGDELDKDGYSLYSKDSIVDFLMGQVVHLENHKGKTVATMGDGSEVVVSNRGMMLFSRRAILRVGMLLRDSSIAKEVRTQLLNIEAKTAVEVKVQDINEERDLMLAVGMAMSKGDVNALALASANMIAFNNRHIIDLQTTIDIQQPKVDHFDNVLNSPNLINITVIAKDLGLTGAKLNEILSELKVIFKQGKTYMPYAKYQYLVTDGYCDYYNFYDRINNISTNNLKWTERGRKFIGELLKSNGY